VRGKDITSIHNVPAEEALSSAFTKGANSRTADKERYLTKGADQGSAEEALSCAFHHSSRPMDRSESKTDAAYFRPDMQMRCDNVWRVMDKCARLQYVIVVSRLSSLQNISSTALKGYTELLSAPKPDKFLAASP
jgi:hypothetical protein